MDTDPTIGLNFKSGQISDFSQAEIQALAHLYRGEMYRSKVWRSRLDMTTNWAVGTTGVALSIAFSGESHPAVTLILVGLLVLIFLGIEARRYRYFDMWRTRVRLLEIAFFGQVLRGEGESEGKPWNQLLDEDYREQRFHISFLEAIGRRLRRNYAWIFSVLAVSYLVKLLVHPVAAANSLDLWERASVGFIPGTTVIFTGTAVGLGLIFIGVATIPRSRAAGRVKEKLKQDPILNFRLPDMDY